MKNEGNGRVLVLRTDRRFLRYRGIGDTGQAASCPRYRDTGQAAGSGQCAAKLHFSLLIKQLAAKLCCTFRIINISFYSKIKNIYIIIFYQYHYKCGRFVLLELVKEHTISKELYMWIYV